MAYMNPTSNDGTPTYTARTLMNGTIVRNTHCPRCEEPLAIHNGLTQHVRNGPLGGTHYGTACTPKGRGLKPVRSKYSGPICANCKRAVSAGHTILFYPLRHLSCVNVYASADTAPEQEVAPQPQPTNGYTVDTSSVNVPAPSQPPTTPSPLNNINPQPTPTPTTMNPAATIINASGTYNTPPTDAELIAKVVAALNSTIVPRVNQQLADRDAKIANLVSLLTAHSDSNVTDFTAVRKQLADLAANAPVQTIINITSPAGTATVDLGDEPIHMNMPDLLELLTDSPVKMRNVWLTGPIGSGKSHAVEQAARLLTAADGTQGVPFYTTGAVDSKHELLGYTDANGKRVVTAFQQAWTHGGVYLQDEYDASSPEAQLALNGATANGHVTFPGDASPTPRHPDCYIICACNTWGFGSVDNLVGRVRTDDSTLSRYWPMDWPIDENLERRITRNDDWLAVVRAVRKICAQREIHILATPRQSLQGAALLAKGRSRAKVMRRVFGRYLDHESWPTAGKPVIDWVAADPNPEVR